MDRMLTLVSATGNRSGCIPVHHFSPTKPPQFGPSHMQIILDLAPMGTVQPEMPGQVLPEPEHKKT